MSDLIDRSKGSVPLDAIIGDTTHLRCTNSSFRMNGLDIATWTYENIDSCSKPPVIAVHGGPSVTHNYLLPLKLLANLGHPVIFYDQAGCGKSCFVANPETDAPWLLTIKYYVQEINRLVQHFNLNNYYVFGSSWGTVVAQEMAILQPAGLLGLILDGALCDGQLYIQTQWRDVISTLPTFTQKLLRQLTDEKAFETPLYHAMNCVIGKHFTSRQIPVPDCLDFSGANREIYVKMQGASEFTLGGVLEHWNITHMLHNITVPALVMMGQYDTMSRECSMAVVDHIPGAWPLVVIPRAGHCKVVDEPQVCVEEISKFLNAVELERCQSLTI